MSLTDFENTIRLYIAKKLQEEFPELSANPGDPLSDLFINPLVSVLKPFIDVINRVDLVQDLSNAELMTEEELNTIGENNYGIKRRPGFRASGYVYVEMDFEVVTGLTVIGPLVVSKPSGQRYTSSDVTIIKFTENDTVQFSGTVVPGLAADYLNPSTGKYEFPVYVEAEAPGPEYNAEIGEISVLETNYPLINDTVTNKEAFVNGESMESNSVYAERLKRNFFTKHLGTASGYRSYVLENFNVVQDVYVSGYGNPAMDRDAVLVRENGVITKKHIGGKVDLYLKGSSYSTHDQFIYFISDRVRLENPRLKSNSTVAVKNLSDPTLTDLQFRVIYENEDTQTGWVDVQVLPGLSGIAPLSGDELEIRYISYVDDTESDTMVYTQSLYYNSPRVRINKPPYKGAVGLFNETTGEDVGLLGVLDEVRIFPIIERGNCPSQEGLLSNQILLDPTQMVLSEGYYDNTSIEIVNGTGGGQVRTIVSCDHLTGICTVDSGWTTAPDATTKYVIRAATYKENSSQDTVDVILDSGIATLNQGDLVKLSYVYNKTVQDVQHNIDFTENRIITTDVLVREAKPIYLYLGLQIYCKKGKTITNNEKLLISSLIEESIGAVNFDGELQLSDIISRMYREPSISDFMDFIQLPVVFFKSDTLLDLDEGQIFELTSPEYSLSRVSFSNEEYPELGMLEVKARS